MIPRLAATIASGRTGRRTEYIAHVSNEIGSRLTPSGDNQQCCFPLPVHMENVDDVKDEFNALDEHQEEGDEPEIVKENRNDSAHDLQIYTRQFEN